MGALWVQAGRGSRPQGLGLFGELVALDLAREVAHLQDIANKPRPIPDEVFTIDEAVNEEVPFLRVEVGRPCRRIPVMKFDNRHDKDGRGERSPITSCSASPAGAGDAHDRVLVVVEDELVACPR